LGYWNLILNFDQAFSFEDLKMSNKPKQASLFSFFKKADKLAETAGPSKELTKSPQLQRSDTSTTETSQKINSPSKVINKVTPTSEVAIKII
jgi:hypothetical protein